MEEQLQTNKHTFNFGKIFEYCILAVTLLLPIVFWPSVSVSLYSAKIVFLATILVLFLAGFLASTLSSGIVEFPKAKFLLPIGLFAIVSIISSIFSNQIVKSVAGTIFELGTSGSIFLLTLLLFVAMFAVKENTKTTIKVLNFFFYSSFVVLLHILLRAFVATSLPEAVASRIPNFLLGGAIDTGIMLGAFIIAALPTLDMMNFGKRMKYLMYGSMILSSVVIGAIGFAPTILTVGLFALLYFVYSFSWSKSSQTSMTSVKRSPVASILIVAISLIFILSNGVLTQYTSQVFKINTIEVRPGFSSTISLVNDAWQRNPVFGVGPNMFKELWDKDKPADINLSQFWATEFNFGTSFIITIVVTTGLLGTLALLGFFIMFIRVGFKSIFASSNDENAMYVSVTSFFLALFIWVMSFVYVPGIAILALAFIFTGVFASSLYSQGVVQNIKINIFNNPKANFVGVFIIVVLLLLSIAGGYFVWERAVANSLYQKGDVNRALAVVETDLYWRTFSENSLINVGNIISTVSSPQNMTESQRRDIQAGVSDAVESARKAIAWNEDNYQNWFTLGRVYEILGANGIQGAVENATEAFTEAEKRAPKNPAIPLALARLKALQNDVDGARELINKSIEYKSNYTDAYFTLAQLEVATNNIPAAIRSVEATTLIDPQNSALYFQLGLLKYNTRDFSGAAASFERAVDITKDYANARYFLGLSYYNLKRVEDAIVQFKEIQKTNPDNQEVVLILKNLEEGAPPFKGANPPITENPQSRANLPIEEGQTLNN